MNEEMEHENKTLMGTIINVDRIKRSITVSKTTKTIFNNNNDGKIIK